MSFYRAALASARTGDLSGAARLARCALSLEQEAPRAARLLELLRRQNHIDPDTLERLRTLSGSGKYKKALKIRLPQNAKAHTIRGLLYARAGRFDKAREEFVSAITLDAGNLLAKQALRQCQERKRGVFHGKLI